MAADHLSTTLSALADPTRRAILARLALGEATVTEIAKPFDMSLPAISKHLKVLEHAGLIARGREAQWRPCRLEAAPLRDVAGWLDDYRQFWEARLTDSTLICGRFRQSRKKRKGVSAKPNDGGKSGARPLTV
jgi:DNA-binding transcriptional ArsR family regulator